MNMEKLPWVGTIDPLMDMGCLWIKCWRSMHDFFFILSKFDNLLKINAWLFFILSKFDNVLFLHVKLNVVIAKWCTPTLHVGPDLALCANIFITTEHDVEKTLHPADGWSRSKVHDNFQTIFSIIGLDVGRVALVFLTLNLGQEQSNEDMAMVCESINLGTSQKLF